MGVGVICSPDRRTFDAPQHDPPAPLEQSWNDRETILLSPFNNVRRGIAQINGSLLATNHTEERKLPGGIGGPRVESEKCQRIRARV